MIRNRIIAAFQDPDDALAALRELRSERFSPRRLGVIACGPEGGIVHRSFEDLEGTQAGPGAGIGAAMGATAGATFALGAAAGVLPGIGPVVVGGALLAAMETITGGVAGTIVGTLVGLGVPDPDAVFYENELADGCAIILVEVRTPTESAIALDVITDHGGYQRRLAA